MSDGHVSGNRPLIAENFRRCCVSRQYIRTAVERRPTRHEEKKKNVRVLRTLAESEDDVNVIITLPNTIYITIYIYIYMYITNVPFGWLVGCTQQSQTIVGGPSSQNANYHDILTAVSAPVFYCLFFYLCWFFFHSIINVLFSFGRLITDGYTLDFARGRDDARAFASVSQRRAK